MIWEGMSMENWKVYKHTLPTGETYIGITGGRVEDRWNNGFGYESQRKFFKRIVATGWDNIQHKILETNLDEETARKKERELIREVSSNDRKMCLNTSDAGSIPKVKSSIGDLPFREHEQVKRDITLCFHFDDVWLERYYHIFNCYPHHTEINNDSVELYWYFDLKTPKVYRIPIEDDIVSYRQLWEYLNRGVRGELETEEVV